MLKMFFVVAMVATMVLAGLWVATFNPNGHFSNDKRVRRMVKKCIPYAVVVMLVSHFLQNELVVSTLMSMLFIAIQFSFFWLMTAMPMMSFAQNHKAEQDREFVSEAWKNYVLCCAVVTVAFIAIGDFRVLYEQVVINDFRFVLFISMIGVPVTWGALKICYKKHLEEIKQQEKAKQREEARKALAAALAK